MLDLSSFSHSLISMSPSLSDSFSAEVVLLMSESEFDSSSQMNYASCIKFFAEEIPAFRPLPISVLFMVVKMRLGL